MPLPRSEWDRLVVPNEADLLALNLVNDALPSEWMQMSPQQLMNGAAVIALRYDRKRQAEALRDRILHRSQGADEARVRASLPVQMQEAFDYLMGRFEATMFEVAEQLEHGSIGLTPL